MTDKKNINAIELYQKFTNNVEHCSNSTVHELFPDLKAGNLHIETKTIHRQELANALKDLKSCWLMYTDEVCLGDHVSFEPNRYLLEAEFIDINGNSNKVKLLHDDLYLVTTVSLLNEPSQNYCYYDQQVYTRRDLRKYRSKINYRLWYKLDEEGTWSPYLQQFLGFLD